MAREVMRGDLAQLPKADVFSLGLVVYELATNPRPLPCNGDEWQELRDGRLTLELLPALPAPLLALLHRMVSEAPAERPPCEELLQHPCVARADKSADALQEERNQRLEAVKAAEKSREQAKEYFQELICLKRKELLHGNVPAPATGRATSAAPPQRRSSATW